MLNVRNANREEEEEEERHRYCVCKQMTALEKTNESYLFSLEFLQYYKMFISHVKSINLDVKK